MPKRSDRSVFPGAFGRNPFKGKHPQIIYKEIQWGNDPKEIIDIDAPEPLAALGTVAKLNTDRGTVKFKKGLWHLALGTDSNQLYIFLKGTTLIPEDDNWNPAFRVKQTDYYSDKGGEECYYYHKHEKPYPVLFTHGYGTIHVLVPQNHNGQRSYAVIKEGIVG